MGNIITYKNVEIYRNNSGYTCCLHPVLGHRVERRNLPDIKRNIDLIAELVNENLLTPGPQTNEAWLKLILK